MPRGMWNWFDSPNGRRSANLATIVALALFISLGLTDWVAKQGLAVNWLPILTFVAAAMILYGVGFYLLEFAYARRWLDRPNIVVAPDLEARLDDRRAEGVQLRNEGMQAMAPERLQDWLSRVQRWSDETKEVIASKSRTSASFFRTLNRFSADPFPGPYTPEQRLDLQVLEERLSRLQRFMRGDPL